MFLSLCLHTCVLLLCVRVVCRAGNRFKKEQYGPEWLGVDFIQDGDVQSRKEMILIKEIVGCLNLIRLSVPLSDIIVLIGSFVSFTHSVHVTIELFSCLSYC